MAELDRWQKCGFTPNEREVFLLLLDCRTEREIAYKLGISQKQAHSFRVSVMRKFDVTTLREFHQRVTQEAAEDPASNRPAR